MIWDRAPQQGVSSDRAMPRVMMVVPQYPYPVVGGLERQAHELARELRALGLTVLALSGRVKPDQSSCEIVEGVKVFRIPWSRKKHVRFLRTPFDLYHILRAQRETYDIIHLHQHSWFGLFTILVAKWLRIPILAKLPNVGKKGLPGLADKRFGALRLGILLRADALVAMSCESLAELQQAEFPKGRVLATPNGIRLDRIPLVTNAMASNPQPCRVVFVGRLIESKRLDVLLAAWSRVVHSEKAHAILELWGSGTRETMLRQQCEELCITDSVVFRGHVEDVRSGLPHMDVFVLPSSSEGNSNAILEAMAAGLPVVGTRVGGTAMQVGHEGATFLCEPGDIDSLATNMLKLIQDSDLRVMVGSAMQRRVERHFNIRRVAETYAAAYCFLSQGQRERIHEASDPVILENG